MTDVETIRNAFERGAKAVMARPAIGQKTYVTKVHVRDGLTSEIQERAWKLTADLMKKAGGNEAGPTPGTFARAALGSCLAMSYVMWAANLDVPIARLEVEVYAHTDLRGMYGVAGIPAGYSDVRYVVSIESSAPKAAIMQVLDRAEAHSPYLDVFKRPQNLHRQVRLSGTKE